MFFRKETTVRREAPWRGRETLLPLELLNTLLGEQLPEQRGRQAGEPSNRSVCGTVGTAEKKQGQTTCRKRKVAEGLFPVHRGDCTVCQNPESDWLGFKPSLRGFIQQKHGKILIYKCSYVCCLFFILKVRLSICTYQRTSFCFWKPFAHFKGVQDDWVMRLCKYDFRRVLSCTFSNCSVEVLCQFFKLSLLPSMKPWSFS